MKLPATLLLTYQIEYETTENFTIDDLCIKYDIKRKQLTGHKQWTKRLLKPEKPPVVLEPTIANIDKPRDNIDKPRDNIVPKNTKELLEDVEGFKQLAVAHAIKFMKNDAEFAEVKEFKDMVAIIDSIEKSYKDTKPENTINIAIQNIVKGFSDDC